MARMDWTRTLVDEPGLRPTTSAAFMPIIPTAIAAPIAAIPTCKFPFMIYLSFLSRRTPRFEHDYTGANHHSIVRGRRPLCLMLANQQREDSSQQCEDQGLDHTHQQLQKIEWNRYQPAKTRNQSGHS